MDLSHLQPTLNTLVNVAQAFPLIMSQYGANLVGFLLPPFIDILNKDIPDDADGRKIIITGLVCIFAAIAINWNTIMLGSAQMVVFSAVALFTESQYIFQLYFKKSALRNKLQNIIETPEPAG